jgi:uncharacterized protein (DUF1015 family)
LFLSFPLWRECRAKIAAPSKAINVPVFLPFRGLRYGGRDLTDVVAPPYDVIDDDERRALEGRDAHNAVRLILPRDDGRGDGYDVSIRLLDEWRADGTLVLDDIPAFYGYRMTFTDAAGTPRTTHGAVGALELPPGGPGTGGVLPHERTIPRHRSDRYSLLQATRANLDPIWGLSAAAGLAHLVGEPSGDVRTAVDGAGVHHVAWPIPEPSAIDAIAEAVASGPLVLADGHHRFETACAYAAEHPDDPGAQRIMALVVELADEELWVAPIHRVIRGVPDVRRRLAPAFAITPSDANPPDDAHALEARMAHTGALGLVDGEGLALLVPRPDVVAPALDAEPPEVREVDAAVFEAAALPRLEGAQLEYRDDAATVAGMVERGEADAAVLLRPVSVAQIRAASYAGVRMPQKTTFFAPKPRTGLVFRVFDA